jgi:hypothetical protein
MSPFSTPSLLEAADALAALLARENTLLEALDLAGAAELAATKERVAETFRQAQEAARKDGVPSDCRARLAATGRRLVVLAGENRRLLERGLTAQGRVIAVIARAARSRPQAQGYGRYGATGAPARTAMQGPLAICARV